MNKHFALAALGALGVLIGCSDGGTTSTTGGGGSTSSATGTGGAGTATSTASGSGGSTATSTATTTGAGGGGPGAVCSACIGMKEVFKPGTACAMKLADCNADADCDSWLKCVQNCQTTTYTAACFAACDQSATAVKNLYQPIYDCTCGVCKTECDVTCP